jgi:hypothetical protein
VPALQSTHSHVWRVQTTRPRHPIKIHSLAKAESSGRVVVYNSVAPIPTSIERLPARIVPTTVRRRDSRCLYDVVAVIRAGLIKAAEVRNSRGRPAPKE